MIRLSVAVVLGFASLALTPALAPAQPPPRRGKELPPERPSDAQAKQLEDPGQKALLEAALTIYRERSHAESEYHSNIVGGSIIGLLAGIGMAFLRGERKGTSRTEPGKAKLHPLERVHWIIVVLLASMSFTAFVSLGYWLSARNLEDVRDAERSVLRIATDMAPPADEDTASRQQSRHPSLPNPTYKQSSGRTVGAFAILWGCGVITAFAVLWLTFRPSGALRAEDEDREQNRRGGPQETPPANNC